MAINHTNDNSATESVVTSAPVQQQTQQNQNTQRSQQQSVFSFHSNGGVIQSPLARALGSEILVSLEEKFKEIFKGASNTYDFYLIPMDKNNLTNLAFSALVVLGIPKGNTKMGAYHTLILEASGNRPVPTTQNINGEMIEEMRFPSEAADSILIKMITDTIQQRYPGINLYNADSMVVPATFKIESKENVHQLAVNASLACAAELQTKIPGFSDLNMAAFGRDSTLVVSPRFERSTVTGIDGLPRRQDVRITFGSQQNKQNSNNRSLNSGERAVQIAEIGGFVDLVWAPVVNPQAQLYGVVPGQGIPTQKYAANLILTSILSDQLSTIGGVLLALSTVKSVTDNNNWYGVFRNNGIRNNKHDIGYLNIEANLGGAPDSVGPYLDTSSDAFSTTDFVRYLNAIIRPGLMISFDVPEAGPESWLMTVFTAAARNDQRSANAQQAIINAALTLTNGAFGQFFPNGARIFEPVVNRVHLGYYEGSNGDLHDIRDVDYVMTATMSKDLDTIRQWSDTTTAFNVPELKRLDKRARYIRGFTNDKAVFTGRAERFTFTSVFLDSIVKGLAQVGVTPRLDSNGLGPAHMDRGIGSYVDSALVGPNSGGFFSSGPVGVSGNNGFYNDIFRQF